MNARGAAVATRPATAGGVGERWRRWRDRLLADPSFQRRVARWPLARFVARRRARALFDLVAGFVYSQVLHAAVRLRLFEMVRGGPRTVADIAAQAGLAEAAALRLLLAAASLGLMERRPDGRFGLGPLGAPLLANPGIAAMVEHHAVLYRDLADPVTLLRGEAGPTALGGYWPYAAGDGSASALGDERVAAYCALMTASQPMVAHEVIEAYPFARHACLLDVGGGEGAFVERLALSVPSIRIMLYDLPAVARRARERLGAQRGLGARLRVVEGDFLRDPLPAGADVATLVRVLHDHDDERALALLRAVRRALPAGAVLVVAEPMSGTAGAEPVGDAYFGMYLLAMGSGRPRTRGEIAALLARAGFARVRSPATAIPLQVSVLVAEAA